MWGSRRSGGVAGVDVGRSCLARPASASGARAAGGVLVLHLLVAPARLCALGVAALGVRTLGLEVRIGIHVGECELHDGKVAGLAVTIGSRIARTPAPARSWSRTQSETSSPDREFDSTIEVSRTSRRPGHLATVRGRGRKRLTFRHWRPDSAGDHRCARGRARVATKTTACASVLSPDRGPGGWGRDVAAIESLLSSPFSRKEVPSVAWLCGF